MGDNGSERSARHTRLLAAIASGLAIGTGIGLVALGLFHLCNPNLRLAGLGPFFRSAWHGAPWYAAVTIAVGLGALGLGPSAARGWRRMSHLALAIATPWLGVGLAVLMSDATSIAFDRYTLGLVITEAEVIFLAVFVVLAGALTVPLSRWIAWLRRGEFAATPRGALAFAACSVAALALLAVGSRGTDAPPRGTSPDASRKLVLAAVDGLEWDTLRSLIDRGVLPNLSALIEGGASGPLSTFRPTHSPLIWTSIATGQPPSRHGITEFVDSESDIPVTSNMRRVPALWNLLGDQGIDVGIIGWWATWPAEKINGLMVSSSSIPTQGTYKGTFLADLDDQTHPASLMQEIRPLVAPAIQAGKDDVAKILKKTMMPNIDDERRRRFVASWVFGADRIFGAAGRYLARRYAPRFLAVYFSATDTVGHLYCERRDPTSPICRSSVEAAYRGVDRELGELLEALGSDVNVLLLSDHGFDLANGHGGQGRLNGLPGVIVMKGPGIQQGGAIRSASIYDIVPTILAFFGLPIADDLRGKPLLTAFAPERIDDIAITYEASRRHGFAPEDEKPIASSTDEAMRERLRILGYIE